MEYNAIKYDICNAMQCDHGLWFHECHTWVRQSTGRSTRAAKRFRIEGTEITEHIWALRPVRRHKQPTIRQAPTEGLFEGDRTSWTNFQRKFALLWEEMIELAQLFSLVGKLFQTHQQIRGKKRGKMRSQQNNEAIQRKKTIRKYLDEIILPKRLNNSRGSPGRAAGVSSTYQTPNRTQSVTVQHRTQQATSKCRAMTR